MNITWPYLQWRYHKLNKRLVRAMCSKLFRDTNPDTRKSIVVAGTGRSGTTWLAHIIASQILCRIMFEPFQSELVEAFRQFHYFHYMRPIEQNNELSSFCQMIFSGQIRDKWIDRQVNQLFPQFRLIKEIRANLFLKWIHVNFPEIPLLFIIRHPCAVVLSRMKLGWATDTDIEPFLSQPDLVDDFLTDKLDLIKGAKTIEEKHALIWCISNLVPLKQFASNDLNIVFYENLVLQPKLEIPKIFRAINLDYKDTVFKQANKPSTTTIRSSAIVTGDDKVTHWKQELSFQQINNILSVVRAFELDHLYNDSTGPLIEI